MELQVTCGVILKQSEYEGKLWIEADDFLSKSEVTELITHLQAWVETGSLELQNLKGE